MKHEEGVLHVSCIHVSRIAPLISEQAEVNDVVTLPFALDGAAPSAFALESGSLVGTEGGLVVGDGVGIDAEEVQLVERVVEDHADGVGAVAAAAEVRVANR